MRTKLLLLILAAAPYSLPATAQSRPAYVDRGPTFLDNDTLFTSVYAGAGSSVAGDQHPASANFGFSAGAETLGSHPGGFGGITFVEAGAIGPLAGRTAPAAYVSYDLGATYLISRPTHIVPFAVAGYSYVFSQGHALNFGVGADYFYDQYRSIRVEARDYYTFAPTPQHNLTLRIGWVFSINDP